MAVASTITLIVLFWCFLACCSLDIEQLKCDDIHIRSIYLKDDHLVYLVEIAKASIGNLSHHVRCGDGSAPKLVQLKQNDWTSKAFPSSHLFGKLLCPATNESEAQDVEQINLQCTLSPSVMKAEKKAPRHELCVMVGTLRGHIPWLGK